MKILHMLSRSWFSILAVVIIIILIGLVIFNTICSRDMIPGQQITIVCQETSAAIPETPVVLPESE